MKTLRSPSGGLRGGLGSLWSRVMSLEPHQLIVDLGHGATSMIARSARRFGFDVPGPVM